MIKKLPKTKNDVHVNQRQLELVRQELKSDITSLKLAMDSRFSRIDSNLFEMKAQISRTNETILEMKSQFAKFDSTMFEMKAMMEEQNNRNAAVFEGYRYLFDRQTDTEARLSTVEKKVFGIEQK